MAMDDQLLSAMLLETMNSSHSDGDSSSDLELYFDHQSLETHHRVEKIYDASPDNRLIRFRVSGVVLDFPRGWSLFQLQSEVKDLRLSLKENGREDYLFEVLLYLDSSIKNADLCFCHQKHRYFLTLER